MYIVILDMKDEYNPESNDLPLGKNLGGDVFLKDENDSLSISPGVFMSSNAQHKKSNKMKPKLWAERGAASSQIIESINLRSMEGKLGEQMGDDQEKSWISSVIYLSIFAAGMLGVYKFVELFFGEEAENEELSGESRNLLSLDAQTFISGILVNMTNFLRGSHMVLTNDSAMKDPNGDILPYTAINNYSQNVAALRESVYDGNASFGEFGSLYGCDFTDSDYSSEMQNFLGLYTNGFGRLISNLSLYNVAKNPNNTVDLFVMFCKQFSNFLPNVTNSTNGTNINGTKVNGTDIVNSVSFDDPVSNTLALVFKALKDAGIPVGDAENLNSDDANYLSGFIQLVLEKFGDIGLQIVVAAYLIFAGRMKEVNNRIVTVDDKRREVETTFQRSVTAGSDIFALGLNTAIAGMIFSDKNIPSSLRQQNLHYFAFLFRSLFDGVFNQIFKKNPKLSVYEGVASFLVALGFSSTLSADVSGKFWPSVVGNLGISVYEQVKKLLISSIFSRYIMEYALLLCAKPYKSGVMDFDKFEAYNVHDITPFIAKRLYYDPSKDMIVMADKPQSGFKKVSLTKCTEGYKCVYGDGKEFVISDGDLNIIEEAKKGLKDVFKTCKKPKPIGLQVVQTRKYSKKSTNAGSTNAGSKNAGSKKQPIVHGIKLSNEWNGVDRTVDLKLCSYSKTVKVPKSLEKKMNGLWGDLTGRGSVRNFSLHLPSSAESSILLNISDVGSQKSLLSQDSFTETRDNNIKNEDRNLKQTGDVVISINTEEKPSRSRQDRLRNKENVDVVISIQKDGAVPRQNIIANTLEGGNDAFVSNGQSQKPQSSDNTPIPFDQLNKSVLESPQKPYFSPFMLSNDNVGQQSRLGNTSQQGVEVQHKDYKMFLGLSSEKQADVRFGQFQGAQGQIRSGRK